MKKKKFSKLRGKMKEYDYSQEELGKKIGRSTSYIAARVQGRKPFTTEDIRLISETLNIPRWELLDCFFE